MSVSYDTDVQRQSGAARALDTRAERTQETLLAIVDDRTHDAVEPPPATLNPEKTPMTHARSSWPRLALVLLLTLAALSPNPTPRAGLVWAEEKNTSGETPNDDAAMKQLEKEIEQELEEDMKNAKQRNENNREIEKNKREIEKNKRETEDAKRRKEVYNRQIEEDKKISNHQAFCIKVLSCGFPKSESEAKLKECKERTQLIIDILERSDSPFKEFPTLDVAKVLAQAKRILQNMNNTKGSTFCQ